MDEHDIDYEHELADARDAERREEEAEWDEYFCASNYCDDPACCGHHEELL